MNNSNTPIYTFVLVAKGLVNKLKAELDISKLAPEASESTRQFLNEFGEMDPWDKAPRHEDGFAKIYRNLPGEQIATEIWSYFFDGLHSFEEMEDELREATFQASLVL